MPEKSGPVFTGILRHDYGRDPRNSKAAQKHVKTITMFIRGKHKFSSFLNGPAPNFEQNRTFSLGSLTTSSYGLNPDLKGVFRMRRAVIDIGTNTVKLLVADVDNGQVVPVVSKDQMTRLGEGVNQSKRLSRAAMTRTIEAITHFMADTRDLGVTDAVALTTSATRDADNGHEFLEGVRSACEIDVQVISGEREAELIFRGVCSDPMWSKQRILVMDVGGGSVEFILGASGRIERLLSLPLGAVRLTEQFHDAGFAELTAFLRTEFHQALTDFRVNGWKMVGTGGTGVTLAKMGHGKADHITISQQEMRVVVTSLNAMSLEERKQVPGLPPDRADIIVAGAAVYLFAMESLRAAELTTSVRNLRYGALLE
jgi:exopolyphosphatase / guanosine-5'-triphosphate,3'-diphosphate pyrophosphatase